MPCDEIYRKVLVKTFDRKYLNCTISYEVTKMVVNLIFVLGTRPHFWGACQLQSD